MFGRNKKVEGDGASENELSPANLVAPAATPVTLSGSTPATSTITPPTLPNRVPNMPPRPSAGELGRTNEMQRPTELPRRPSEHIAPAAPPMRQGAEIRELIVGREISLSGEIKACDRLVVEGSVEANLANCRDIDIAVSGLFKGSASIDEAEIRGRFEGTLTVKKRLFIRATGKVVGSIRYGQIEIECGGQISGDIQAVAADVTEVGHTRAS
jgi:cytoskeletal protein CcmA (bactofilin family)